MKGSKITSWTTAKVKDTEQRLVLVAIEQGRAVLADIVVTGAIPEGFGIPVEM